MTNDNKRSRYPGSRGKRQAAAKHAAKKQQKNGTKFKNAEIRAALDSQIHILYSINKRTVDQRETRQSDDMHVQTLTTLLRDL